MTQVLAGGLAGLVVGFLLGIRSGVPYARAVRAYRDWRGTKDTVRGLRRRTVAMWVKAVKQWAVALLALAGLVWLLVSVASR